MILPLSKQKPIRLAILLPLRLKFGDLHDRLISSQHVDKATKRTFLLAPESFDSFTREANGLFMRKIVWFTYVSPLLVCD